MRRRPGRSRSTPFIAVAAIAVAGAGCAPDVTAQQQVVAPREPPQPQCAPIVLDDAPDAAPTAAPVARSPGPALELSILVRPDAKKRTPPAPRKPIDLGSISQTVEPPYPFVGPEPGPLKLPRGLPLPDLTDDLARLWERDGATERELTLVLLRRARAERMERRCQDAACAERACIEMRAREHDAAAQAIRERWADERRELCASLQQHLASQRGAPPAGVLLALASTLDDMARREGAGPAGELAARLKEPISLYGRAATRAGPASDIGWFAHYRLGLALEDIGENEAARGVFIGLARASSPGERGADAAYRVARLTADPEGAAYAYQRAATLAEKGTLSHAWYLAQWSRAALLAEQPADALAAGTLLCDEAAALDDGAELLKEGTEAVAEALGRLLALRPVPPLPKVPTVTFAPIAARVADGALSRFDVAQAVKAWEAILALAPGSAEAPRAREGLAGAREREKAARSELPGRLRALARDCADRRFIGPPLDFAVTAGPAKVTARPVTPGAPPYLARCLEARGAAYLVDAPAELRATLTLRSAL